VPDVKQTQTPSGIVHSDPWTCRTTPTSSRRSRLTSPSEGEPFTMAASSTHPTATPDLQEARALVLDALRGYPAKVFLYGSFARGEATYGSDIDIAVLPERSLPPEVLSALRERLAEAPILYDVNIVDLSRSGPQFRERVLREGKVWSDSTNG
jgi:predicted nucleotidyltransferase